MLCVLSNDSNQDMWLFCSLARGDWDARSDEDLLAVAANQSAAELLADALRQKGLDVDMMALSKER